MISTGSAAIYWVRVCVFAPLGVYTECQNCNPERAQKLLVRVSPYWGKTTCLRLALEADDKNFVAQSGVQVGLECRDRGAFGVAFLILLCSIIL